MKKFFGLLALLTLLLGCEKKFEPKPKRLRVAATIAPYAYFTERIGTTYLDVISILPPSVDIHTYEPTPREMEKWRNIDLWVQIGAPFEERMMPIMKKLNPDIDILNMEEKIPLLPINRDTQFLTPCEHSRHDRDMHAWMSVKQGQNIARVIAQRLVKLDKVQSHEFSEGLNSLLNDLTALDSSLSLQLKDFVGAALLVAHPSLGYFCNDYQLTQYSIECEGKEPLPADLQNLEEELKKENVLCVFAQKGFDRRGAQIMADKLGIPVYELDPLAKDYFANMKKIGNEIADAGNKN